MADAHANYVLIVEDSPDLRESLKEILDFAGYKAELAVDACEALDVLNTADTSPHLIISDILMPRMDGFQFLTAVRARSWKHIPFLFISGQEATSFQKDPSFGTVGYLSKPFGVPELLEMITRILAA
jgi:CheY-like chemotaxis protein